MKEIVSSRKAVMAIFSQEGSLKKAVQVLEDSHAEILEIRSPYDLDMDEFNTTRFAKNSGRITFWCGLTGFLAAIAGVVYLHNELPIQFAIKPTFPWLSFFIPAFLAAVLFASLGLCVSFFINSHLIPGQQQADYNCKSDGESFLLIFTAGNADIISDLAEEITEINYYKQNKAIPFPIKMEIK
ncbi:MAG: DUF3341 domain-containing protein [Bacteroidetes bacterium]|nr:DUF3341 domain-containing protein [Bacteroidota bacterium]